MELSTAITVLETLANLLFRLKGRDSNQLLFGFAKPYLTRDSVKTNEKQFNLSVTNHDTLRNIVPIFRFLLLFPHLDLELFTGNI